jgi:hypothetical protein
MISKLSKTVARFLRRIANRIDPPSISEIDALEFAGTREMACEIRKRYDASIILVGRITKDGQECNFESWAACFPHTFTPMAQAAGELITNVAKDIA